MAFLNIINQVKENTSKIISEKGYDNVNFVVEYSRSGFGDITCNIAFLLAKNLKKNPQEIAEEFAGEYNLGNDLEKVEAHKSGYLNFFINNNSFTNTVLPDGVIEIQAYPDSNDVIGLKDLYLVFDVSKSKINMVKDTITSGEQISGVGYKVTSSYTNGDLIRG